MQYDKHKYNYIIEDTICYESVRKYLELQIEYLNESIRMFSGTQEEVSSYRTEVELLKRLSETVEETLEEQNRI